MRGCDERCSRFNACHSLHPDCASQYFYHAVKCATTGKLGKALLPKALPKRHRSIREGASEIPLRGTFVIGAGSPEAQLPTAAIRDRSHDIQITLDDGRDKDLSEDGSPVYRNGACAPPRALG